MRRKKDNIRAKLCELGCDVNSIIIAQDVPWRDFVETATERSGFITIGSFEITVVWDFTPCSLVDCFGGTCCLLQGSEPNVEQKMARS
jgi:hypothetical protein